MIRAIIAFFATTIVRHGYYRLPTHVFVVLPNSGHVTNEGALAEFVYDHHTTGTDTETQTIQVPAANEQPHATSFSDKSPSPPTRRTFSRTKTLPAKFKDYVMNVVNIEH